MKESIVKEEISNSIIEEELKKIANTDDLEKISIGIQKIKDEIMFIDLY